MVGNLVYWPTASSMKSSGTPHRASMTRYGIRKAPPPDL